MSPWRAGCSESCTSGSGGRAEETDRTKARHRASARPHGGRLTRRDVWLAREVRRHVVARAGDSKTGKVLRWHVDTEDEARQMVKRLMHADAGQWREQAANLGPQGEADSRRGG